MPESINVIAPLLLPVDVVLEASSQELPLMQLLLVRGDTRPTLRCTVRDKTGVVVPITGATPRLYVRRKGETTVRLTKVGTVVDGPNGVFDITRAAADYNAGAIDAEGHYEGEVEITFSDATVGSDYELIPIHFRNQVA